MAEVLNVIQDHLMSHAVMLSELMSRSEVCKRYRLHPGSVSRALANGHLPPAIRIGCRQYWRVEDLLAFEQSRMGAPVRSKA